MEFLKNNVSWKLNNLSKGKKMWRGHHTLSGGDTCLILDPGSAHLLLGKEMFTSDMERAVFVALLTCEGRGQPSGVGSLLPQGGSQGLNSGLSSGLEARTFTC